MSARTKIGLLAVIAFLVLGFAVFLYSVGRVPWARRQNVVVVVIDTLRQDHLPSYGYQRELTPFLSPWTDHAAQFDAVSPTSWTKPAVASILTGLHPVRHQAYGRTDMLPASIPTLAAILKDNGYSTMAVVSNGWVSPEFGMNRGFDSFDVLDSGDPMDQSHDAPQINAVVLPKIKLFTKQPFFLYVHYSDPHSPYHPSMTWEGKPLPPELRKGLTTDDLDSTNDTDRPAEVVQRAIDLYDGEIRQTDTALQKVFGALHRAHLLKNTLVIVTADHGEELNDHRRFGHGQTLFGEVTRVPLIIRGPGIPSGRRTGQASLLDITPTILGYLRIPAPAGGFDGTSLVPTLANPSIVIPARDMLFHLDYQDASKVGGQIIKVPRAALAFITDMQKFVINKNPYQLSLFDLRTDPGERRDRTGEKPQLATDLAGRIAETYNEYSHRRAQRATVVASNETRRAVLALGYLSGADQSEPRNIPPGIHAASIDSSGALGWLGTAAACANTTDPDDEKQLLKGWSFAEHDGRWTQQQATAIVATEDKPGQQLTVTGINHRPDPFTVTVSFDGAVVASAKPARGPLRLTGKLPPGVQAGRHTVTIATDSFYQPSAHGQGDTRRLGIYVSSICVQ